MAKQAVLPFFMFCEQVLKLKLRPGQRVLAKVAFGDLQPKDLSGEELELSIKLFGGVMEVSQQQKRFVLMRLGRGSGKTTLIAAYACYRMVTADISLAGPGSVPYFIIIAPDKPTAEICVRMAREMIKDVPALERLVVADTAQKVVLRRIDGRLVQLEAFAASGKGSNVRSRDIMDFLFEEAEFLTSNADGERDFAVNDEDIFRALKPRLMPGGKGILISTPWPVETLMGRMFERNWGKPFDAVAIKAPTTVVRDEPHIQAIVEEEIAKDPDNARREFFCELDGFGGGDFFEPNSLHASLVSTEVRPYPGRYNPLWPCAVGCDLGFTSDSSAIAVVQFDGSYYNAVYLEEMRPRVGQPLKPSVVIKRFAQIAKDFRVSGIVADGHYRESLKEHLEEYKLSVFNAPEGSKGKSEVFQRTRAVLHEGLVTIPENKVGQLLVQQAKLVTSKPSPGGMVTIKIPRKVGLGHGDLVSAWTLAVHSLAYKNASTQKIVYEYGTQQWKAEFERRLEAAEKKQQDDYLKKIEKEAKKAIDKRAWRRLYVA